MVLHNGLIKIMGAACLSCCFILSSAISSFADTASDSNAAAELPAETIESDPVALVDEIDVAESDFLEDIESVPDEDFDNEHEEEVIIYEISSASDAVAYLENIDRLVTDLHSQIVPSAVSDQGQYSICPLSDGEVSEFDLAGDFAIDNNVVIYEGTFNGRSYRLVFPAAYEQNLIITDEGYLYNLSGSTVTGRLFDSDQVDYLEYEYDSFILNSVLGNVASTIYNYDYPSYMRSYRLSNGRITTSDTYGLFRVDNVVRTVSSDPVTIGNYYMLILIMIGGLLLLCFMKKSLD